MLGKYRKSKQGSKPSYGDDRPLPFKPSATEYDYRRGFMIRYFAVERLDPSRIYEVSERQFRSHNTFGKGLNSRKYDVFSLKWKISGPERDIYKKRIPIRNGVYDTNRRMIDQYLEEYPGLDKILNDPLQFWEGNSE